MITPDSKQFPLGRPTKPSLSAQQLFRRFCRTALSYWRSEGPRCAWPLTVGLALVVLVSLGITYGINLWNRHFFDALEARNAAAVLHQGLLFPLLIAAYLALCVFGMWARMTMQRTWRAWMNNAILDRWVHKARYYQLECVAGDHKNPEHRINDDLRIATEMPVDFATGLVTAALSAATFFSVLWTVGGELSISIAGVAVSIDGFLVFAAIGYALIANGCMLLIGRRFIVTTERKNQAEAEYRFGLTRARENAESIALLGGDKAERAELDRSFARLLARWRDLVGQHMRTVVVSQANAQLCGVIPILLCTPRYLDATMTLGQIMQVASAFTIVQSALSWIVDNYTRIAEWSASARRVASLMHALDVLEQEARRATGQIVRRAAGNVALEMRNLSVTLADGSRVVNGIDAAVHAGEKVLIVGDSGAGKSALVRAIAGCWPWGDGEILQAQGTRVSVIPQRAYIPAGTLRNAVMYPMVAERIAEDEIGDALAAVGLAQFVPRLDDELPWEQTLSEGEKQRLAFARLLVHRADIVVLDEATSALHVGAQQHLMQLLHERMPDLTLISIGHRPELESFHRRKLTLRRECRGARFAAEQPIHQPRDGRVPVRRVASHSDFDRLNGSI